MRLLARLQARPYLLPPHPMVNIHQLLDRLNTAMEQAESKDRYTLVTWTVDDNPGHLPTVKHRLDRLGPAQNLILGHYDEATLSLILKHLIRQTAMGDPAIYVYDMDRRDFVTPDEYRRRYPQP